MDVRPGARAHAAADPSHVTFGDGEQKTDEVQNWFVKVWNKIVDMVKAYLNMGNSSGVGSSPSLVIDCQNIMWL